jgi:dinuclear metal center YbgI/SA1388 family protein
MTEPQTGTATVADVVAAVHGRYNPAGAAAWDAVGLVCGDPAAPVRRVLLAVDPDERVVEEALGWGADLLLTHHPLLLRPVSSVAATTPAGRVVQRLIAGGVALLAAHTNADVAADGVNDALAEALGLVGCEPLMDDGLGRVGDLDVPESLAAFAQRVSEALPDTVYGARIAGDLAARVRRVAVCGGSGSDVLPAATAAGADVVVTADLKHHVALDHLASGGPALVDVSHWASEWLWLPRAASLLEADLAVAGVTVETRVSEIVTDPWTARL